MIAGFFATHSFSERKKAGKTKAQRLQRLTAAGANGRLFGGNRSDEGRKCSCRRLYCLSCVIIWSASSRPRSRKRAAGPCAGSAVRRTKRWSFPGAAVRATLSGSPFRGRTIRRRWGNTRRSFTRVLWIICPCASFWKFVFFCRWPVLAAHTASCTAGCLKRSAIPTPRRRSRNFRKHWITPHSGPSCR